jgi:hypothetical protein
VIEKIKQLVNHRYYPTDDFLAIC